MERANDQGATASLQGLTATNISVQAGRGSVAAAYDGTGQMIYYSSGYYRLILLALE